MFMYAVHEGKKACDQQRGFIFGNPRRVFAFNDKLLIDVGVIPHMEIRR